MWLCQEGPRWVTRPLGRNCRGNLEVFLLRKLILWEQPDLHIIISVDFLLLQNNWIWPTSPFGEILTENGWKHRISQNPKNVNFVARLGMIWDLGLLRSQLSRQYFSSNEKGALGFDWPLLCRFYLASIGL